MEARSLGYREVWTTEAQAHDAFTPLVLASQWVPDLRLGTGITSTFTRGPAILAQTAATLASLAPGRVVLGIGASSHAIVENWNGIPYKQPYTRTRDVLRFLRLAFAGQRVKERFESFDIRGYQLGVRLEVPPPIFVAALRPRMLQLAAEEADGVILNWLSARDVSRVMDVIRSAGRDVEVVDRIMVCPNPDAEKVRSMVRPLFATYLNTPVYAAYHRWLGREDRLAEMWDAWNAGDRKKAADCVPDSVIDELVVHGTVEECWEHLQLFAANGVTTLLLAPMAFGIDAWDAVRAIAELSRPGA